MAPRPGDGQPDGRGGWRPVRTGEFLHGYEDEDGAAARGAGRALRPQRHVRRLPQAAHGRRRVPALRRGAPTSRAARSCWPPSSSAAGPTARRSSITRGSTTSPTPSDPDGLQCPLGAHIRRANPRDSPGFFGGRLSNRHRIIRRGRSYGPPLPPGATEDDGVDRGLIFVCFNASIWRQFETVQALWIDDGDPFGLGPDKDFLVGEPHGTEGKMTIQGHPPFFLKPQPRFVTMRGGEYLFRPSMAGLRFLAEPDVAVSNAARETAPGGMVEIEFHLVDFMDARPLPRASVEFTLTVVPRFPVLPDDGPGPPQPPRPDQRFAESLRRTVQTDSDGRAALSFDATDVFSRLTGLERDDPPGHSVDAVGALSASARLLGIRLPRAQLAGGLGPAERLEHTLPADLGMSIVGHTTPETARLWFHLPFEPASDHSFTCHVAPARAGAPAPAAGPVDPATDLGPPSR